MSYSSKGISNNIKTPILEDDGEFSKVVSEGRNLLENKAEFQTNDWSWTRDLDDGGIFIFCYLLHDYSQKTLTINRLKERVYTLDLLRHKMLPSQEKSGLPRLGEFQVIFTLYERLKREEMSWDDCEEYINEQIAEHRETN